MRRLSISHAVVVCLIVQLADSHPVFAQCSELLSVLVPEDDSAFQPAALDIDGDLLVVGLDHLADPLLGGAHVYTPNTTNDWELAQLLVSPDNKPNVSLGQAVAAKDTEGTNHSAPLLGQ